MKKNDFTFPVEHHVYRHRRWVSNFIDNIRDLWAMPPVTDLSGTCCRPALIIGTGPSLDHSLEMIAANRDRFNIVATSSSLRSLQAENIVPDFTVGVEFRSPQRDFEGIDHLDQMIGLFPVVSHPLFFSVACKEKYICYTQDFPLCRRFFSESIGPAFPRVVNVSAFGMYVAFVMGADDILFFGQDLSFPGGKQKATAAADIVPFEEEILYVPGVRGDTVATNRVYGSCIASLGKLGAFFKKRGVTCYNVDSRGALIENFVNVDFSRWLAEKNTGDIAGDQPARISGRLPGLRGSLTERMRAYIGEVELFFWQCLNPPYASLDGFRNNMGLLSFIKPEHEEIRERKNMDEKRGYAIRLIRKLENWIKKECDHGNIRYCRDRHQPQRGCGYSQTAD